MNETLFAQYPNDKPLILIEDIKTARQALKLKGIAEIVFVKFEGISKIIEVARKK